MSTPFAMKTLIVLWTVAAVAVADSSSDDIKKTKPSNTIQQQQQQPQQQQQQQPQQTVSKQPVFFHQFQYQAPQHQQPQQQQQATAQQFQHTQQQVIPVQFVSKPLYVPQPTAMVIITAQAAPVAQQALYGAATQHLLNYFNSHPQAKYQLLHGDQQHQQQQQQQQQPQPQPQVVAAAAAQTVGNYQFLPAPYQHSNLILAPAQHHLQQGPAPQSVSFGHAPQASLAHLPFQAQFQAALAHPGNAAPHQQHQHQQPMMQLSQIAHLAQLAAQQYANTPSLRSAPAIVTGLENFSPEQQAQIKAQLSSHLGNPINAPPPPPQQDAAPQHQYSSRYLAPQDFVPSQPIKNDGGGHSEGKTHYNKG